ncbi:O-acetyl-ADP-ribose deacetylase [Flammeovirgaceae bacterium SG7u.111]|nr:O-acetyl-ADP-ribose deacetylase [Flammeovirgaceae bacterium SG7u.132]WPO37085.1 O-acetyl-ADP-ribose deacetylase [Flammeovirgaceae bacterium SG7u.111]
MNSKINLVQGDLTKQTTDAIVNAANSSLLGGGGVDGAIHRAAGGELLEECRLLNGCPTGEAKITKGYNLPAKHVIHTVGPVWKGGERNEPALLEAAYRNSLQLAEENGLSSIAFPNISTGIYHFPKHLAAQIAMKTVVTFLETSKHIQQVVFVCFDNENYSLYQKALA